MGEAREERRAEGVDLLGLMQAAVAQASDAIVITNAELDAPGPTIVYVNPAFTRMTGYAADEAVGRSPRFLQGPKTDRAVLDGIRTACASGAIVQGRSYNYRKDGGEYLLDWQIAPIRDAAGTVTHFVAIQQDITAAVRLEAQYRQAQKMEAVGQLAGGIAHDFNNLLTVISASTRFAREALPPDGAAAADLAEVEAAAARAAELTRQLLAFSRQQPRQPQPLDLNLAVAGVERMLARVIGEDVRLVADLARDAVPVVADPGQLEQVLMNLAVNARDAMPNGGTLTIGTRVLTTPTLPPGRTPPSVAAGGRVALLSVEDTGTGMSAEVLERAFEPFYTTKALGKGTGLGLATVYGIVEQSGGAVWVESAVGRGTTVCVVLPLADPRVHATPVVTRGVAAVPAAARVLLVEDDDGVRTLTKRLLERVGHAVVEARDGRDATARWAEHADGADIDVLVTDVVMPGGTGHDLMAQLRARRPELPVVLLSGYAPDARLATELAENGTRTAFLEKPFTAEALWEQVGQVLRAAGARGP